MKIVIKNIEGKQQGELEVKFPLIEDGKGTQAVHDVVVAYQAAQRMGTACTKNVGEVSGSNKKPWRQKGRFPSIAVVGGWWRGLRTEAPRLREKGFQEHPPAGVAQGVERTAQGR
jgi:large subunit ribosomal protein L4